MTLGPALAADFSGSALPSGWSSSAWTGGGSAAVAGGSLVVNGARAITDNVVRAWTLARVRGHVRCIAVRPRRRREPRLQLAVGNLQYQEHDEQSGRERTPARDIPGNWIGSPHRYRIEWTASEIRYYVDGALVATHASLGDSLRVVASEFDAGGEGVSIDWLRLSPYASPCSFTSRVLDAGEPAAWGALSWAADTPPGTSVAFEARSGDTPVPDGAWSPFVPIATSGDDVPEGRALSSTEPF